MVIVLPQGTVIWVFIAEIFPDRHRAEGQALGELHALGVRRPAHDVLSFTAALALGLLAGWPLDEVHRRAGAVAAYVCSRPGGTPELPDELRAPFLTA